MASSITRKAILFDFLFPMYEPICTIFTKHFYSQYNHSVQFLHFQKKTFCFQKKHSVQYYFHKNMFVTKQVFSEKANLQSKFTNTTIFL